MEGMCDICIYGSVTSVSTWRRANLCLDQGTEVWFYMGNGENSKSHRKLLLFFCCTPVSISMEDICPENLRRAWAFDLCCLGVIVLVIWISSLLMLWAGLAGLKGIWIGLLTAKGENHALQSKLIRYILLCFWTLLTTIFPPLLYTRASDS